MTKNRTAQILPLLLAIITGGVLVAADKETEKPRDIAEIFASTSALLAAPAALLTNVAGRETVSLNGDWNIIVDEHEVGEAGRFGGTYFERLEQTTGMEHFEHHFDERRQLRVPGDWNTQDDRLFRYRGVVWYQRSFSVVKEGNKRYFIHFDGVNYAANIYLNGQPLATHKGGYVAFNVEATAALVDGENFLVVRVDARLDDTTVPTLKTSDFFKYSGITRDVNLVTVPETFVRQYHVWLDDLKSGTLKAWVQLDGAAAAGRKVELSIREAGVRVVAETDQNGLARLVFKADLALWSPAHPKRYEVKISTTGNSVPDRIGFRSIKIAGGRILLNGKPVFLRGINMHEASYLKPGVAFDRADAEAQLGLIKELNGNFVRLAHYPHNEHTVRTADELGLLVWSEIPIVSLIDWTNKGTLALAKTQLSANIYRDLNRAAVIIWSIGNETMPQSEQRLVFLGELAALARSVDESGRPIASALVGDMAKEFAAVTRRLVAEMLTDPTINDPQTHQQLQTMADELIGDDIEAVLNSEIEVMLDDKLGNIVDIIGYNEYFGWYYSAGLSRMLPVDEGTTRRVMFGIMHDIRFRNVFGKPIIISEFGAGAKKGYQSKFGPGKLWSEEYQARVYEKQVDMLSRNSEVQGMSPWLLMDFRSAMRPLNGIQDGYNRKGIVSEAGEKKQAFFVLKDFYTRSASK